MPTSVSRSPKPPAARLSRRETELARRAADAEAATRRAAAAVELVSLALTARSRTEAADIVAEQLRAAVDARSVAVGLVRGRGPRCRLVARSGGSEVRRDSDLAADLGDAMAETAAAPAGRSLWTRSAVGGAGSPGHRPLAERTNALAIVSAATTDAVEESSRMPHAVIVILDPPPDRIDEARMLLDAVAGPLDGAFAAVGVAERSWRNRIGRAIRDRGTLAKLLLVGAAAAMAYSAAVYPVPHRIVASCVAEPAIRRDVVAPVEGLVEQSLVEVGDRVEAGQLLGRIEGRDLEWERAGKLAEQSRAARTRDAALAIQDIAAAQKADLERQAIAAELAVLDRRAERLEIRAPIAGQLLAAEVEKGSTLPVRVGTPLFQIGRTAPLRVELEVPADLWDEITVGQALAIAFDGLPESRRETTVARIRPEIDTRDGRRVLIAEAELTNADGLVRPGLRGSARIRSGQRPLWQALLSRTGERVRRWLWW